MKYFSFFVRISALFFASVFPLTALAYGQGNYYSQGGYYSQGYYQASYTGGCGTTVNLAAALPIAPPQTQLPSYVYWDNTFLHTVMLALATKAYAYGQGTYYAQGPYYTQGYYQASYATLQSCITKYSYSAGDGGYAPNSFTYWGGGGGGGLIINGSAVQGSDGNGAPGNGGKGYGAGGGGSYYSGPGGSGAPGVVYVEWDDQPPSAPSISGPISLQAGATGTYTFTSTDPESDSLRYDISWGGNGSVSQYVPSSGYVGSGAGQSASHTWNTPGTYSFCAMAEDNTAAFSGWTCTTVVVAQPAPTALLTTSLDPSDAYTQGGAPITLTWSSSNATDCLGTNFTAGGATSGSTTVTPTTNTTYTITCNGPGGSTQSSKTITYSCQSQYVCSGNNLNHVDASCTSTFVQSCSYQCSAGACIAPPPPSYNSFQTTGTNSFTATGHLQIAPALVLSGLNAYIYWNISSVSTCTISGTNGDSWSGAAAGCASNTCSSTPAGKLTSQLTQQTTYTLSCTGLDGTHIQESVIANVIPIFHEF